MCVPVSAPARTGKSTKANLIVQLGNLQSAVDTLNGELSAAGQRLGQTQQENLDLQEKLSDAEAAVEREKDRSEELQRTVDGLNVGSRASEEAYQKSINLILANANGGGSGRPSIRGSFREASPDEAAEVLEMLQRQLMRQLATAGR